VQRDEALARFGRFNREGEHRLNSLKSCAVLSFDDARRVLFRRLAIARAIYLQLAGSLNMQTPFAQVESRPQRSVLLSAVHAAPSAMKFGHVLVALLHSPLRHTRTGSLTAGGTVSHAPPGAATVTVRHVSNTQAAPL
jgi:hypothetical protein